MKKLLVKKLVLLVLFMHCGQILAQPLLACCVGMEQMSGHHDIMTQMEHPSHHMMDRPHAMEQQTDTTMSDVINEEVEPICNFDCAACFSSAMSILALTSSPLHIHVESEFSSTDTFFTSLVSENLLRPPIAA